MEKIVIKKYNDFENVVNTLKVNKNIRIDLEGIDLKLRIRILDLVAGYVYERGDLIKENKNEYMISMR